MRVVLADHQPVFLGGLRALLHRDSRIVVLGEVSTWAALRRLVREKLSDGDTVVVAADLEGRPAGVDLYDLAHGCPGLHLVVLVPGEGSPSPLPPDGHHCVSRGDSEEAILEAIQAGALNEIEAVEDSPPGFDELSHREREVFALLVEGLEPRTIARRLRIARSTVHTYTERVKWKLGVDTIGQVVRYAFEHHLAA